MIDILTDTSKEALARAVDANRQEFQKVFFGSWPKVEVHHDEDMFWFTSELPSPRFNNVMWADLAQENVDSAIEEVIARFSAINRPLSWFEGTLSSPANLGERLEKYGFVCEGRYPCMALDISALNGDLKAPPELVIKRVLDNETLRAWGNVFAEGYDIPNNVRETWMGQFMSVGLGNQSLIYHYMALLNGVPVAVSSLVPAVGVGGIYNVATIEDARRQGIGAAVTLAPLIEARDMGYRFAVLTASELGFPVYKRIGFETCSDLSVYMYKKGAKQTSYQPE